MSRKIPEIVYMPHNEPYLGRETVMAFDEMIVACLNVNSQIAPITHTMKKSDLQWAACQLIPQSISIALSIRELVRQGHLFGALVLIRPLAERSTILLYLQRTPSEIKKWKRGWRHNEAPSFAKMLTSIGKDKFPDVGRDITRQFNSIAHGKPDSAVWSLIDIGEGQVGHGVSKIIDNPVLCDKICLDSAVWLSVVMCMMQAIFPN